MAEVKFPTEVVDLPSKGLLYPKDSPLSSGKIEIKYMTAKEEDILTSANLIKKGIAVDKLLDSLIVDKTIKTDELLIGDKNAVLIAVRILAYGRDYEVEVDGKTVPVDLTELKDKFLDERWLTTPNTNEFEYELPSTKRKLTFKLLNSGDDSSIAKEVEGYEKMGDVGYQGTTRLKHIILSVDGDSKKTTINNFVDNEFLSRDAHAFRSHISAIMPDVDMTSTYRDEYGEEKEFTVPMTVSFLWPSVKS